MAYKDLRELPLSPLSLWTHFLLSLWLTVLEAQANNLSSELLAVMFFLQISTWLTSSPPSGFSIYNKVFPDNPHLWWPPLSLSLLWMLIFLSVYLFPQTHPREALPPLSALRDFCMGFDIHLAGPLGTPSCAVIFPFMFKVPWGPLDHCGLITLAQA